MMERLKKPIYIVFLVLVLTIGFVLVQIFLPVIHYDVRNGEAYVTGYRGRAEIIEIKSEHRGYPVVAIDEGAFSGNDRLITLILPDTLEVIGEGAFFEAVNLETVFIPDDSALRVIADGAFAYTYRLKTIELEKAPLIESIGDSAFAYSGINRFIAGEQLVVIDDFAFFGSLLVHIDLSAAMGLRSIGDHAFAETTLKRLILPEGLESFGTHQDDDAWQLHLLTLPESLLHLPPRAFHQFDGRPMIFTPHTSPPLTWASTWLNSTGFSVVRWGNQGIDNHPDFLFTVTDDYVIITGLHPFSEVTDVIIPETISGKPVEVIAAYAFAGSSIRSVEIPFSVRVIENGAFKGATLLSEVIFDTGSNLTHIDYEAFASTALETVTIPQNVIAIGTRAFYDTPIQTVFIESDIIQYFGNQLFIFSIDHWANPNPLGQTAHPNLALYVHQTALTMYKENPQLAMYYDQIKPYN